MNTLRHAASISSALSKRSLTSRRSALPKKASIDSRSSGSNRAGSNVASSVSNAGSLLPSPQEFFKNYGLTPDKLALARPDAIVLHPGPMNRGIEIDSSVADGRQSVILPQVTFGIAVRMAVMSMLGSA